MESTAQVTFGIGAKVQYKDINLRHLEGVIVDIGNGPYFGGGDCLVTWHDWNRGTIGNRTSECTFNLQRQ